MNSVRYIMDNRPLSHEDKVTIKALGRPLPKLQMKITTVGKSRGFNRYFKQETSYDRYQWMCGCPETKKLFCFVCLVSGDLGTSQWTSSGVCDLQHLQERAIKHANGTAHLNHLVDFNLLGDTDVHKQLNSAYLKAIVEHNEEVDKNRKTLRRLIMCLKFSGALELPLHKCDFQGIDVFEGLINLASKLDYSWEYLSEPIILEKDSKLIRNELLDAILQVCKNEVVDQVKRANYLALIVEKTEDGRLVILFRYFLEGQIFERIWNVVLLEKHTGENISKILLNELETLGVDRNKLIAQSSNIPFLIFGDVQAAIKEKYPNAFFVHSYHHHFKIVLENAAFRNKMMMIFFGFVQSFEEFFSKSSHRIAVLDELVQKKRPWTEPRTWNFETGTVKELYGNTELFYEYLDKIIESTRDTDTIRAASGLSKILDSEDIDYYLEVVYPIVKHVEVFFERVQSQGADGKLVSEHLNEVEGCISGLTPLNYQHVAADNEFDEREEKKFEFKELSEGYTPISPKRRRVEADEVFELRGMKVEVDDGTDASTSTSVLPSPHITADEVSEGSYELCEIKVEIKNEELHEMEILTSTSKLDCLEAGKIQEQDRIAKEYRTSLVRELKERFHFTGYISADTLFSSDMFQARRNVLFPDSIFEETINAYPFIDKTKLKMELTVLYGRGDISCSGLLPLLVFIYRNRLQEGFSEVYKLLDIVCTTPMATREAERCFSTLKMVKNFVTNAEREEELSALAMLSVEKNMVQSILDFDNKVINIFAETQNGADFKYM